MLFILLWLCGHFAFSQSSKVLLLNDFGNSEVQSKVLIKWYSQQILYPEGVNVYRRSAGTAQWIKLNNSPIIRKAGMPAALTENDEELEFFVDLINASGDQPIQEQMLLLNVLVKSFESNEFADFLGIYFEDETAQYGEAYSYRIQKIVGGKEVLLSQSQSIQVGKYRAGKAVDGFEVSQVEQMFALDWEVDEDRFFAVNVYRTAADSLGELRINQNPIMLTEVEDSTGSLNYPSPKFYDAEVLELKQYVYQIAGLGFFGEELQRSVPITLTLDDVTPPMPPTNLSFELDTMLVQLFWDWPEDPGIKALKIYRSSKAEGPYVSIYQTGASITQSFNDSISIPGPYYYYVSSVDHSNNEADSRRVFVQVPDQDPPLAPTGLTIASDTGKFHLNWKDNKESDFLGYLVFRTVDDGEGENFVLLTGDPITTSEYHQRLPKNVTNDFFFFVVALDSAENRSQGSKMVSGRMPDVIAPERPKLKEIQTADSEVIISWIRNVDQDLMGYQVYRSDSVLPLSFQLINQNLLSKEVTQYTDRRADSDKAYLYVIEALDMAGNSSEWSESLYAKPSAQETSSGGSIKTQLRHRKKRKTNTLTWESPEGEWIGYVIYKGKGGQTLKPATGLTKDKLYTDNDLDAPVISYQVRAYADNGKILKSEVIKWEK